VRRSDQLGLCGRLTNAPLSFTLSGQWKILVDDHFKKDYDTYVKIQEEIRECSDIVQRLHKKIDDDVNNFQV
jgi:hypothetical protein